MTTEAEDRRERLYGATRKSKPAADPKMSLLVDRQQSERAHLLEKHRGEMHKLEMKHSREAPQSSIAAGRTVRTGKKEVIITLTQRGALWNPRFFPTKTSSAAIS